MEALAVYDEQSEATKRCVQELTGRIIRLFNDVMTMLVADWPPFDMIC